MDKDFPRVRFAPSPTGQVHIGNIRAAIFNWLFARNAGGKFILRIEDTDRERSTDEAVEKLLDCMDWLGLDYDEPPLRQSSRAAAHLAAADRLLASGSAFRPPSDGERGSPIIFRIPYECADLDFVREVGIFEAPVHPETPVVVAAAGVKYAGISGKGKPIPDAGCLAGFVGLEIFDAGGARLFSLDEHLDEVVGGGQAFTLANAASMRFRRREVAFEDMVKGRLAKPLDTIKDLVVVRGDGAPIFHLANVVDDIEQRVSHVIRGDDHVENTYRHLFLFAALGAPIPQYAHLPMIVNAQGKPYSKRDGDAFVGEFRDKGFLPEALFNYLSLLGWSPGDEREKLSRRECVELFSLHRVRSAPAQFDVVKMQNLNAQYVAELPPAAFAALAAAEAARQPWGAAADPELFRRVAALMQSRVKVLTQVADWEYFFSAAISVDSKLAAKFLGDANVRKALGELAGRLETEAGEYRESDIEAAIRAAEAANGIPEGKLNQAVRVAVTGTNIGAGVYETLALIPRGRVVERLRSAARGR